MLKSGFFKNFKGGSILLTGLLLTAFSFLFSGCLEDSNVDELNKQKEEALLKQLGTDTLLIKDFLAKNNITNAKSTPSGLFYIEQVAGTGVQAQIGNAVKVHYRLYSISGDTLKAIETSYGKTPFQFRLNTGTNPIPGFQQGVSMMRVGGKSRIFIPSFLAYQDQAQSAIEPNSVLIFDLELLEAL